MNDSNLKALTPSEARELGRKGGLASGESRRKRKQLKECLQVALEQPHYDLEGHEMTKADAIAARLIQSAIDGDVSAARLITHTCDGLPVAKVETTEIPPEVYAEVEKLVNGD